MHPAGHAPGRPFVVIISSRPELAVHIIFPAQLSTDELELSAEIERELFSELELPAEIELCIELELEF